MLTNTVRTDLIRLAAELPRGDERHHLLTFLAAEKWIPKDLEEGRCTPAPNPDCPVGSPQYNLAQTFKSHPEWGKAASKLAKDLPKDVERYVEEGMDQGMDESKAWAVAWSRYCKYKNPGSPHCKQDKGDYFPGNKSSTDKEAIRPRPRKKNKCDGKQETYADYMSCGGTITEKAWESRQRGSHAFGIRASGATITERDFDSLRPRQRIWMTISTAMSTRGEREFEVGRTTYSKKYDVYSKTLYPVEDGVPVKKGRAKYTMFKRPGGDVSVGFGGMGTFVKSFRTASEGTLQRTADQTLRSNLIRLASTMPKGDRSRQDILYLLASEEGPTTKVAHKPMNPEVTKAAVREGNAFMTYRIDAEASAKGTSKFYEGFIRPEDGGYTVVRQWGALTDKGTPKNTRSKVVFFDDLASAQRDISRELAKRIKRQYIDAFGPAHKDPKTGKKLPMGQYPIGLYRPGLGFGWGTQSIGACIPALRDLQGSVTAAIESIESGDTALEIQQDLTAALADIERGAVEDSTMATKLKRQLGAAVRRLTGGPRFLPDPEGRKLRKQLVAIRNYVGKQLAYCG
jgi:predicted DNA-binding WGR domain protein